MFAFILLALISVPTLVRAQTNVDLEVLVENSSDSARGGEPFAFTATVRNAGSSRATRVAVLVEPAGTFTIVSAIASRGACETSGQPLDSSWGCSLDDLGPGESIKIQFSGKLMDVDDPTNFLEHNPTDTTPTRKPSHREEVAKTQAALIAAIQALAPERPHVVDSHESIAEIYTASDESDKNPHNDRTDVRVKLLPSRNAAPKVRIVSPAYDAKLVRPSGKSTSFDIVIEAVDPDGTIDRVIINEPLRDSPVQMPDGSWRYRDTTYSTTAEVERAMQADPPPNRHARRTGTNTFTYKLVDPPWGHNSLSVAAYDNGGRTGYSSVMITVNSDSTIEVVNPKSNQIVAPGSTLVVETVSRVRTGVAIKEVLLDSGDFRPFPLKPLPFELVSRQGNVYRHRFVWKNVHASDVFAGFRARLVETSGATNEISVGFLPRLVPKLSFSTISQGQVFKSGQTIPLRFDIVNPSSNDQYELYIDGRYKGSATPNGYNLSGLDPGPHSIQIVVQFSDVEITRSELVTIIVK